MEEHHPLEEFWWWFVSSPSLNILCREFLERKVPKFSPQTAAQTPRRGDQLHQSLCVIFYLQAEPSV